MKYFGDIYTMVRNMGVMDDRTGLSYSHLNLPDEVAEWLLKNKPTYEDRILTIEDYEKLGRPTYEGLQTLRLMGLYPIPDDVPRGTSDDDDELTDSKTDENETDNGNN